MVVNENEIYESEEHTLEAAPTIEPNVPLSESHHNALIDIINDGDNVVVETPTSAYAETEGAQKILFDIRTKQLEDDLSTQKELHEERLQQRGKLVTFFIFLIPFHLLLTFGVLIACMVLMSLNLISREESEGIFSVVTGSFVAMGLEIIALLGIVVLYFFSDKRSNDKAR